MIIRNSINENSIRNKNDFIRIGDCLSLKCLTIEISKIAALT